MGFTYSVVMKQGTSPEPGVTPQFVKNTVQAPSNEETKSPAWIQKGPRTRQPALNQPASSTLQVSQVPGSAAGQNIIDPEAGMLEVNSPLSKVRMLMWVPGEVTADEIRQAITKINFSNGVKEGKFVFFDRDYNDLSLARDRLTGREAVLQTTPAQRKALDWIPDGSRFVAKPRNAATVDSSMYFSGPEQTSGDSNYYYMVLRNGAVLRGGAETYDDRHPVCSTSSYFVNASEFIDAPSGFIYDHNFQELVDVDVFCGIDDAGELGSEIERSQIFRSQLAELKRR